MGEFEGALKQVRVPSSRRFLGDPERLVLGSGISRKDDDSILNCVQGLEPDTRCPLRVSQSGNGYKMVWKNQDCFDRIKDAALKSADPRGAVARHLLFDGTCVLVDGTQYTGPVSVLAIGKAASKMFRGAQDVLGGAIQQSLIVTKHGECIEEAEVLFGDHPVPGARSEAAAERVIEFVDELGPEEVLLLLLSGGGSALVAAPVDGVRLEDLAEVTNGMLRAGAAIEEINTVRRHLDVLKGGGLAERCRAKLVTLVISDVVGDALEAIASGPTAFDPSTPEDAIAVLKSLKLETKPLLDALTRTKAKAPKVVQHVIVGSCAVAVQAALETAQELGFHVESWGARLNGEASELGKRLGLQLRDYRGPTPVCFVGGGESTVTVVGDGLGGRNLEVALGAVGPLTGTGWHFITFATDGEDGPTDAAGAWVDGQTFESGRAMGLDVEQYLQRNASYEYFEPLGALLRPGPTGTNVNDLVIAIRA